jgi:hypothetical protein
MRGSWRCCREVVTLVNRRFTLDMDVATRAPPDVKLETICVQARCNATLAHLYAHFLFYTTLPCVAHVSTGQSEDAFLAALHSTVRTMYSLATEDDVTTVIEHRRRLILATTPSGRPRVSFSTVHHFKGDECDLTILAADIRFGDTTGVREDEFLKYVAVTRARFGVVDLHTLSTHGHPAIFPLMYLLLSASRSHTGKAVLESACTSPSALLELLVSPSSTSLVRPLDWDTGANEGTPTHDMISGVVLTVLTEWSIAARGHAATARVMLAGNELKAHPYVDHTYQKCVVRGDIPPAVHREVTSTLVALRHRACVAMTAVVRGVWTPTQDDAIAGALAMAILRSFLSSRNVARLAWPADPGAVARAVRHALSRDQPTPGILGHPACWAEVCLGFPLTPTAVLSATATLQVLIVENTRNVHAIVLTAKRPAPGVDLTARLIAYHARSRLGTEIPLLGVTVVNVVSHQSTTFSHDDPLLTDEAIEIVNRAITTKATPVYYGSTRPVTTGRLR